MSSKTAKDQEPISHQALLDENHVLQAENHILKDEIQNLKARLDEAEELKRAISEGDLDALIIPGPEGELVFTLGSADRAYRVLVETMNEGTATLGFDGTILYCNRRFGELLKTHLHDITGSSIYRFLAPEDATTFRALLEHKASSCELKLQSADSKPLPVYLSISSLQAEGSPNAWCLVVTDLTEQKKNEEILASERLARSIIEQAAEIIVVCDISGRIIRFSNAMSRLCECDPTFLKFEDLINLRFSEGENVGESVLPVSSTLKGSTFLAVEATLEIKNRRKYNLLLNSEALKKENGEVIGCVLTLTDITGIKLMENTLKRNEQLLSDLLNSIQDGFFELDKEWRFTYINQRAAHNGNFEPEELVGECIWEKFPYMANTRFEEVYRQVMETRLPANFEIKSLIREQWYGVSVYPSESGISTFWKDITDSKRAEEVLREAYEEIQVQSQELQDQARELREAYEALSESEKRYRLIFNNSMDAIILTDPRGAGKVLSANPATCRMLGFSEKELLGKTRDALFGTENPAIPTFLDERVRSGSARVQTTYKRKDGTTLIGELSSTLFTDINGEPRSVAIIRDITERKQALEALQESEKRFELLSEANALLLSSKDPEAVIQIIAEKVMRHLNCDVFFNYVFDELKGKLHLNAYGGIKAEVAEEIEWLEKGAAICGCVALEGCRIVSKDVQHNRDKRADLVRSMGVQAYACQPLHIGEKTIGTLSFGTRNRKGFTGDELALISTVADQVSVAIERKRAEQALRETRNYLENLLDYANAPIIVWDSSFKITRFNHAFERLTGLKTDEVFSKPLDILFPESYRAESMRLIKNTLSGERWEVVEIPILHVNGSVHTVLWNSANIHDKDNSKVIATIAQGQDITERKRTEEALKQAHETLEEKVKERTAELEEAYNSLLESEMRLSEAQKIAHLGNWDWNLQTDELYWSDEIYRIFRLDPLEIVPTYNEFLNYVDPDNREHVYNATRRALNGKFFNIDYRIITPGGEKRIVHSQGEVFFNESGTPVRMRGILQDITERKMAEQALERIDKIRIKEIHHRIKNNLQVISSLLDLQAEKFEDEKVIEAFREGQNRVISMSLLHEELYKGEGADTINFSVYLKKLTENLFENYTLSNTSICLRMDLEENSFFDMDTAVPLGIIVTELVSNSLKHAFTEKEGEIKIQLYRDERNEETNSSLFSLTISDNGKGIPEDIDLESVESLGLQLVSILVDQLDGEIEIKREQGTEFRIAFKATEISLLSD